MTLTEEIEYGFVAEVADEIAGSSRRKWALLLLAFVAGLLASVYIRQRLQHRRQAAAVAPVESTEVAATA